MIDYYGNKIEWVPVLKKSKEPLYIQISNSIENDICEGRLKNGFKLPPQRIIANYLGINHSTVTRAYKLCEEKGFIKGIIGKGTFVSSTAGIPSNLLTDNKNIGAIEFGMMHPVYEVNELIKSAINDISPLIEYDMVLKYTRPEGHIKHRYIASKWLEQYRIKSSPDNIIITSGTQNALSVILTGLFNRRDRIAVDELSYTGFKNLANLLGIILIPVKRRGAGMDPRELETVCKREKVSGIYLMPDCHNPTGITMNEKRREEIADVIKKYNLMLIEDAIFSFCLEEKMKPISSLIPERSIYIHGTSKALNPSFRISYIVSPVKYVERLKHCLNSLTWMASPLNAEIVSLFQTTGKYTEIADIKVGILKKRNKKTDEILREFSLIPSKTSMFRYLLLPSNINDTVVEDLCLKSGVQVFSSKRFLTGTDSRENAVRLSISSPENNQKLIEGLKILKNLISKDI